MSHKDQCQWKTHKKTKLMSNTKSDLGAWGQDPFRQGGTWPKGDDWAKTWMKTTNKYQQKEKKGGVVN